MGRKQAYEQFPVRLGMSTYEYENSELKLVEYDPEDVVDLPDDPKLGVWSTKNLLGYDPALMWEDFSYSAYPLSTDSASAATAMASGIKTYNGAIGVDISGDPVELVSQRAEALGKATGVVTTVQWSHATPAGFVAHNTSRNDYAAIAKEMIYSSATDVIMGAGHPWFDNDGKAATTPNTFKYVGGEDTWDDLVAGTAGSDADGDGDADYWTLVQTKAQFEALAIAKTTPSRVCGTAQVYTTIQQSRSGDGHAAPYVVPLNASVPSLAVMTEGALNVLDNDQDGFFLMVEGGAIDWASHANQTGRTIEEEIDFNKAVDAVIYWVNRHSNWNETVLIVTGDHETGMLYGPESGMVDGVATYAPIVNNGKGKVPGVSWNSHEHSNALIPLYAKGGGAQFLKDYVSTSDPVRGAYVDNTNIAHLIFSIMK
ncbi:MAG: alkaline phosphatase [Thermoleophilia bacterium]|nr:alkaline phosphatase [Thermoleophilia bacterium]